MSTDIAPEITFSIDNWASDLALPLGKYVIEIYGIQKPEGKKVVHTAIFQETISLTEKTTQIFKTPIED